MADDKARDAKGRFVAASEGIATPAHAEPGLKPGEGKNKSKGKKTVVARQASGAGCGAQERAPHRRAFTPEKQARYLAVLAESANGTKAAKSADVCKSTVINWRKANADFAARWRAALVQGYADLEMDLLAQARFGLTEESKTRTDKKGVTRRTVRRDSGLVGIRLLAMNQARAIAADLTLAAEAELVGHAESEALVARISVALQSVRLLTDGQVERALDDRGAVDAGEPNDADQRIEVKGLGQALPPRPALAAWRELNMLILIGGQRLARLRDGVAHG